jgi:Flp pilus assembly protein TadD
VPGTRDPGPSAVEIAALPPRTDAPRPSTTAVAPALPGTVDACASPEDTPAPATRPSVSELLRLRVDELNDRMLAAQRRPDASAALRGGWEAALTPGREDEALRTLAQAPDRRSDGFDTYVAVAVVLAANAMHAGEARRAIRFAELAARAATDDPLPLVIGAVAHEAVHETGVARELLAQAFALESDEPAIALRLAWYLENGPDPAAAIVVFDAYLAAVPDDRDMARRRARLAVRAAAFSGARRWERGGVHLVAAPTLTDAQAAHVLEVVDTALAHGASLLGVGRREELTVFVHPTGDAMRRATCMHGWVGAVFDGALETDAETVASGSGDAALRHECFHAAIHPRVPSVPTWLDEGLAEYASGETRPSRIHSYELMVHDHTWIAFATMNDAFLDISDGPEAGLAYDQALAMVEWLVDRRGTRGIRDAAAWLIGGGDPSRVLAEAAHAELDGETLLAFVAQRVATLRAEAHAPPR